MLDPLVGKTLCGYRVEKLLSRGTERSVYRATQLSVDRPVALKILSLSASRDRDRLRSFLEEARSAGRLRHPGLVDHHEVRQSGDFVFSSMEFLPGGTLESLIQRERRLSWPRLVSLLQPVVAALAWMEAQGSTHGRLNPRRILLAADGRWKLLHGGGETAPSAHPSEAAFLAPERLRGAAPDVRSDVYSLGSICYYALSGSCPRRAPLSKLRPDLPKRAVRLVERMLSLRPERRPQSFAEVERALAALPMGFEVAGAGRPSGPGIRRLLASWRLAALLLVAAGAIVVALVAAGAFRSPRTEPKTETVQPRTPAPEEKTAPIQAPPPAKPETPLGTQLSVPASEEPKRGSSPEPDGLLAQRCKENLEGVRGALWAKCWALDFDGAAGALAELTPETRRSLPEAAADLDEFFRRARDLWEQLVRAHPWVSSAVPEALGRVAGTAQHGTFEAFRSALLKTVVYLYLERLAKKGGESPFRGKTEFAPGGLVHVLYEFESPEEVRDFVALPGSSLRLAARGGALELAGECRFLDSSPFRGSISVAAVISEYDARAPNVNVAFFTSPGRAVTYAPGTENPEGSRGQGARQASWDYLALGFGYMPAEPLVPSLKLRSGTQRVLFPCVAVLAGRAGKTLHEDLDWDCLWGANYLEEPRGKLVLRASVAAGKLEWEVNGRKLHAEIPKETFRGILDGGTGVSSDRAGSLTFFTNGRRVLVDSLEIVGSLDEAWLRNRLLQRALEELEKSAPEIPWRATEA